MMDEPVNAFLLNGEQMLEWKTENLPAGVYYCRLQVGDRLVSKKIIKMR
jgi:hypothetical protein